MEIIKKITIVLIFFLINCHLIENNIYKYQMLNFCYNIYNYFIIISAILDKI